MPRGIEIGDRVRDENGVIWEYMHADLGERWCIGLRPVGRRDDTGQEHSREEVVAAIRVAPYSFEIRDGLLKLWDYDSLGRGQVRWEEKTWWQQQEIVHQVKRVVVPDGAMVSCPKCGDSTRILAGQQIQLGVTCKPGHVRVLKAAHVD